jgi:hypothetical protein
MAKVLVPIQAKDEYSKELKKFKNSVDDVSNSTSSLSKISRSVVGSLAAVASVQSVIRFYKDCRSAAQEFQKTQIMLSASLGYTSNALEAQAGMLQKVLYINDEVTRSVQSTISYFTKDEAKIADLTRATMDFAAATGMDAVSAARLLGRAIDGGASMLTRYGIRVKDTGDELTNIDNIIKGVNSRFGGQAEALSKSKDMWDRLALSLDDFKESIGLLMKSSFWKGDIENKGAEYVAFMDYNYKNAKRILADADNYSADVVARAKARIQEYEADPEINKRRDAQAKAQMDLYFKNLQTQNDLTKKLQEELWALSTAGQRKLLQSQKDAELNNTKLTQEQKALIIAKYNIKFQALDKGVEESWEKIQEDRRNKDFEETKAIYENREKAAKDALAIEKRISEQWNDILTDMRSRDVEESKKIYEEKQRLREEDIRKEKEAKETLKSMAFQYSQMFISIANITTQTKLNQIDAINASFDSQEKNVKDTTKLEKKRSEAIDKINRDSAAKEKKIRQDQKKWSMASTLISGAQATMDAWASSTKLGIPAGIIAGIAASAIITGVTIAQVTQISRQKFATGGLVPGTGNGDTVDASLTPGEGVLTRQDQLSLFNMIRRGGTSSVITMGGDTIIVNGNLDQSAVAQLQKNKESNLLNFVNMYNEATFRRMLRAA